MKKQYHYFLTVAIIFFISFGFPSFLLAQSKKEIKAFRKIGDKYVFNVKMKNKQVSEKNHFRLQSGSVIVPVTINGKIYNFAFDTGATTLFSDSLAKELKATSSVSLPALDAAGIADTIKFYSTDNVCLGNLCFDNVGYGVTNLDAFETHLCMRIDGLLGVNIIKLLNWEIDFSNQIITVSDKPFLATDYGMEIPFEEALGGRTPEIKMKMGEYSFWATLDMGNNDLIQIPDSLFFKSRVSKYLKYAKGEGKNTETLFNDETPQNQYISQIDTFYMGNNLIVNEMVCITPSTMILIGNKFLMKYGKIAINWKQKKIFLGKKDENKMIENDTIDEFVPTVQDNQLIVSFIWENTDAYRAGIRLGDQITSINGISTEKINSSQWCEISEEIKNLDNPTVEIVKKFTKEKVTLPLKNITYKSLMEMD